MKHILTVMAAAAIMTACTPKGPALIAPMASAIDIDKLDECTVPASFTSDDFRWMGGNLTMTVYDMDLYDAVEVSKMNIGDTLIYESRPILVQTIDKSDSGVEINGGLDNGGCCLAGYEGGAYVARDWDDHATYTKIGKAQIPLADDFVVIDCGLEPFEPSDTIRTAQKLYLETLEGSRREFFVLNTLVTIQNGVITQINRRWIP